MRRSAFTYCLTWKSAPDRPASQSRSQEYLHLVAALNNVDTANAGGFVLAVKPDGSIQYTLLADIRELALSHR